MHKKFTRWWIILIGFAIVFARCAQDKEPQELNFKKDKVVGVVIRENAVLRIDPIVYSARVALIKRAEIVEVLGKSKEPAIVGGAKGYWYKVKAQNGIVGWMWGKNIRFFTNESKSTIDSYVSEFWEKESERLKKLISGRWWSINKRGDFTEHALEIFPEGKYKSYVKGGQPIEGIYNINLKDNEVVFVNGTTFKTNLNIVQRGTLLFLEKETDKDIIKFQKIASKIDEEKQGNLDAHDGEDAN
ncbi:MAG: SH3 domain-containing protein [Spirochaetes bacterium]|nr:SH3 domain-containing protein [Spirochaetota bacterium]